MRTKRLKPVISHTTPPTTTAGTIPQVRCKADLPTVQAHPSHPQPRPHQQQSSHHSLTHPSPSHNPLLPIPHTTQHPTRLRRSIIHRLLILRLVGMRNRPHTPPIQIKSTHPYSPPSPNKPHNKLVFLHLPLSPKPGVGPTHKRKTVLPATMGILVHNLRLGSSNILLGRMAMEGQ